MKPAPKKAIGWFLIGAGLIILVFCQQIVFPGLERIVGIENIVGKENVIYLPGGGYEYTNPGGMMRWIFSVAFAGMAICGLGIRLVLRAGKDRKNLN